MSVKAKILGLTAFLVIGVTYLDAEAATKYAADDASEGIRGKAQQCHPPINTLDISVNAGYYSRLALVAVQVKEAFPNATIIKYKRVNSHTVAIKFLPRPQVLPLCIKFNENGVGH